MLSRIAESLFWIGRYIERADGTARILDVHLQLLRGPVDRRGHRLPVAHGRHGLGAAARDVEVTRGDVLTSLAVDRANPSSIAYAVQSARENAPRARDRLDGAVGDPQHDQLADAAAHQQREGARVLPVGDASARLAIGVTDSSTSRDEAWQFLTLGRAIERTDMTARLLATRALTEASGRRGRPSCARAAPTRRICAPTAGCRAPPTRPSSCCSTGCSRGRSSTRSRSPSCMSAIDPVADRVGHSNTVLRALGRIRNDLEYRPIERDPGELPEHMELQKVTREASEAIRDRFFPTHAEPSWIGETS
jgi:hypothetical protein